jgi:hypothetical protein
MQCKLKLSSLGLIINTMIVASAVVHAQPTPPSFTATPTSGRAPLMVKFCAMAGITIDFGDGASSGMDIAQSSDCPTGFGSYTTHTYATAGVYQLRGIPCPGVNAAVCGAAADQASAVKITVTSAP